MDKKRGVIQKWKSLEAGYNRGGCTVECNL